MNQHPTSIRRALISVSDKTGLAEFVKLLQTLNIEILSTGGTANYLREKNIPVTDVSSMTQFPEIMDGRVKTLHPLIHGGILGLRDHHAEAALANNINWIDLVVVNLYPFAKTIQKPEATLDDAFENIDIGGPTMIRSAAKNRGWVTIIVDPDDYKAVADELTQEQTISYDTRARLSAKAFLHTAHYDAMIADYLNQNIKNITLYKKMDLRYGENPHQRASLWQLPGKATGLLGANLIQGKPLSYNNLVDAEAAFACVKDFSEPACVIVKHATPCGVAIDSDPETVFAKALSADPLSAFGGIVALNCECSAKIAKAVTDIFMEVLLAPSFSEEAKIILQRKPNLRVLEINFDSLSIPYEMKYLHGGMLIQTKDTYVPTANTLQCLTDKKPDAKWLPSLLFAAKVAKHVKSNAIVIAEAGMTLGIGGGQVSRVDAVELALTKAGSKAQGAVLASDAFFPFRDGIDVLAASGICAIIQPGGSMRDEEVIEACNQHGIAMVMTGVRSFRH